MINIVEYPNTYGCERIVRSPTYEDTAPNPASHCVAKLSIEADHRRPQLVDTSTSNSAAALLLHIPEKSGCGMEK